MKPSQHVIDAMVCVRHAFDAEIQINSIESDSAILLKRIYEELRIAQIRLFDAEYNQQKKAQ